MNIPRVVNAKAAKKASFHCCAGSAMVFMGATTKDDISPAAPSMSPLNKRRVAADRPMRPPPMSPDTGVKELRLRDMMIK